MDAPCLLFFFVCVGNCYSLLLYIYTKDFKKWSNPSASSDKLKSQFLLIIKVLEENYLQLGQLKKSIPHCLDRHILINRILVVVNAGILLFSYHQSPLFCQQQIFCKHCEFPAGFYGSPLFLYAAADWDICATKGSRTKPSTSSTPQQLTGFCPVSGWQTRELARPGFCLAWLVIVRIFVLFGGIWGGGGHLGQAVKLLDWCRRNFFSLAYGWLKHT